MSWIVDFHPEYEPEFDSLDPDLQDEILAYAGKLEAFGPELGRPHADTLSGTKKYKNLKELRFNFGDGVWRVAYAFDPERKAVLLVGGDKSGQSQKKFYKALIAKAEKRFRSHLESLKGTKP
jgi:hypothetical protein